MSNRISMPAAAVKATIRKSILTANSRASDGSDVFPAPTR